MSDKLLRTLRGTVGMDDVVDYIESQQATIIELTAKLKELEDEIARFRDPLAQGED